MSSDPDPVNTVSISAVICTHNRASVLASAIESLLSQDLPPERYEVLVVDNRSTDGTRELIDGYGARLRRIEESTLGLSQARNAGWRAARGAYVAMLDDDAIADPAWLRFLLQAFDRTPRPGCVGGRITPLWESPRPIWLNDRLLLNLTVIDWAGPPRALDNLDKEWLAGANLAFPRDILQQLGGFSPRLGRAGDRLLSGEEIQLQRRLLAAGSRCWYEPRAQVQHRIPASRLRQEWFRRRAYAQGTSDARLYRMERQRAHGARWRLAAGEVASVIRSGLRNPGLLRAGNDAARFEEQCGVLWRLGYAWGLMGTNAS